MTSTRGKRWAPWLIFWTGCRTNSSSFHLLKKAKSRPPSLRSNNTNVTYNPFGPNLQAPSPLLHPKSTYKTCWKYSSINKTSSLSACKGTQLTCWLPSSTQRMCNEWTAFRRGLERTRFLKRWKMSWTRYWIKGGSVWRMSWNIIMKIGKSITGSKFWKTSIFKIDSFHQVLSAFIDWFVISILINIFMHSLSIFFQINTINIIRIINISYLLFLND
jgi:hypothetical protein